jgi:hypothetical protein
MSGRPAIVVQILIRRDAQVKFISFHGIKMLPAKLQRGGKTSATRRVLDGASIVMAWLTYMDMALDWKSGWVSGGNCP